MNRLKEFWESLNPKIKNYINHYYFIIYVKGGFYYDR